jgi:hypothetical protein
MTHDLNDGRRPESPNNHRQAETTGSVAHASGVQIGLLLLLVLVNLLVLWVLWTVLSAG